MWKIIDIHDFTMYAKLDLQNNPKYNITNLNELNNFSNWVDASINDDWNHTNSQMSMTMLINDYNFYKLPLIQDKISIMLNIYSSKLNYILNIPETDINYYLYYPIIYSLKQSATIYESDSVNYDKSVYGTHSINTDSLTLQIAGNGIVMNENPFRQLYGLQNENDWNLSSLYLKRDKLINKMTSDMINKVTLLNLSNDEQKQLITSITTRIIELKTDVNENGDKLDVQNQYINIIQNIDQYYESKLSSGISDYNSIVQQKNSGIINPTSDVPTQTQIINEENIQDIVSSPLTIIGIMLLSISIVMYYNFRQ